MVRQRDAVQRVIASPYDGYILQSLMKVLYRRGASEQLRNVCAVNSLGPDGRPWFIHSGTYEELLQAFRLSPSQVAQAIRSRLEEHAS